MGQAPYKTGPSVFLCHAGEDKDRFVEPLYKALVANGLKPDDIFYDKFSIQAGHDIKKSIESALASPNLQLVVTVLSRNLLCEHKYWPKREFELAQRYGLPIFPVWLGHDFGDFDTLVRKYSPTLKGIRALSVTCDSQTGIVEDKIIQDVADNIIKELPKTTKRSNAGFGVLALVAAIVVVIAVISQFITGCPIPNRPENGQVRFETRTHGSLATYTCTAGYDLAGLHMRECVNGQWTGSQPVCEKTVVLCPPVEGPANGAVQVSGRQTGDRARFTCAPGYEMKGTQSTLCQDGVWVGDKPTCEPKGKDVYYEINMELYEIPE
ncbi:PREDICTED: uncharacterized protein LOC109466898 [Branchiostoma belcheri]|uniref:Uncharacterized protein LOC109466898 n=1 Tax=Branchiostoma belcheri TaxID=7741 RepID=A0A6P4Y7C5_BRABE|nr:PREDICTED: uncharacterized protein LOC109466898 [Branchiostoma belcheri]